MVLRVRASPLSAQAMSDTTAPNLQMVRGGRQAGEPIPTWGSELPWQVAGLAVRGKSRAFGGDHVRFFYYPAHPRKGALFVVSDAVGVARPTTLASRLATEVLAASYFAYPSSDPLSSLLWAFRSAHQRLEAAFPPPAKAGVTLLAAVVRGSWLFLANVGDCRAYLVRSGQARLLGHDHRWVTQEVLAKALSPAQAARHPWRRVLTRWLGRGGGGQPDLYRLQLQPGDVLVLCSDGLWEAVREGSVARAVIAHPPGEAVRRLIRAAVRQGEGDDIAALVVRFAPVPWMVNLPSPLPYGSGDPVPVAFQLAGGLSLVTWLIALGLRMATTAPR